MQELLLESKKQVRPQAHHHNQQPRSSASLSRSSMGSNAIVQAKLVGVHATQHTSICMFAYICSQLPWCMSWIRRCFLGTWAPGRRA
jgi:hypothetical protein